MRLLDDRFWYAKVAVLAGVLLLACRYAGEFGPRADPPFWHAAREPARFDGREIWVPGATLSEVADGAGWIRVGEHRVRVRGVPPELEPGWISLRGTFRAAHGGYLETLEARRVKPAGRIFVIRYALSAAVLAGWLFLLHRRGFRLSRASPALLEARR